MVTLAIGIACAVGILLFPEIDAALVSADPRCSGSGDVPTPSNIKATRAATLCLLNDERADEGLPALRYNTLLEEASQRHSADMGRRRYFAHDSPDGIHPAQRVRRAGYPTHHSTGENLAWGTEAESTPVRIVEGWMQSPGHRANILEGRYVEVGVGVAHEAAEVGVDGRSAIYTTNFGGPPVLQRLPRAARPAG